MAHAGIAKFWKPVINVTDLDEGERLWSAVAGVVEAPAARLVEPVDRPLALANANAGVRLTADSVDAATTSTVTLGVVVGLVAGKAIGIAGETWGAVRFGWADLPGATWRHLLGVAALGGIGFTVSLFMAALAFDSPRWWTRRRSGCSPRPCSPLLGATLLRTGSRRGPAAGAGPLDRPAGRGVH